VGTQAARSGELRCGIRLSTDHRPRGLFEEGAPAREYKRRQVGDPGRERRVVDRGVMIIHAPSETMNMYAGTPYRLRMQQAKPAEPPVPIERRCDESTARNRSHRGSSQNVHFDWQGESS